MHALIDPQQQLLARRYHREVNRVNLLNYAVAAIFILILVIFNWSKDLLAFVTKITTVELIAPLLYFVVLYTIHAIITAPLNYWSDYVVEHKYNFSTQNRNQWFRDLVKSFLVGLILGLMVFEAIYWIVAGCPRSWWIWLSLLMILFSVVLANLFPVLILPLFYKTSPLQDEALKNRLATLCNKTGIDLQGIFTINLSSKTTKANAAVVGLGNTKKILIGDNLIRDYTEDEIVSAVAHEITHYRRHHVWQLIAAQALITIFTFFLFNTVYPYFYQWAGFTRLDEVSAFPLFIAIFTGLNAVLRPLGAGVSRFYERQADQGALILTQDPRSFISLMAKFCNTQLIIAYPNAIVEWYKYSHPAPGRRISFAEKWKPAADRPD